MAARIVPRAASALFAIVVAACVVLAGAAAAHATGKSATGDAAFQPCAQCHPVTVGADGKPTKPLPIDLEKHEIVLEVHDILGVEEAACLACHSNPNSSDPGNLILPDGTTVGITSDDISRVCQRCHFERYRDWEVGIHGRNQPKCSAAGCHDPHTPSWIYVDALPPFQGTGIEVRAVAPREPFMPMTPPPPAAPVETAPWLVVTSALGAIVCLGLLGFVIRGRVKR